MSDFTPIIPDENNIDEGNTSTPPTEGGMQSDDHADFFSEGYSFSEPNSTEENSSIDSDLSGISNPHNNGFDGAPDENTFGRGQNASIYSASSSSGEGFNFNSSDGANEGYSFSNSDGDTERNGSDSRNHFESASNVKVKAEKKFDSIHLGYKQVAILIAGVLLALAIIISVIYNVASGNKAKDSSTGVTNSSQSSNTQPSEQASSPQDVQGTESNPDVESVGGNKATEQSNQQTQSTQTTNNTGTDSITALTDGSFNYGEDMIANATVTDKTPCVTASGSVVYKLDLQIGQSTSIYSYYCNRNAYDDVNIGEQVKVKYSAVDNRYLAIVSVTK